MLSLVAVASLLLNANAVLLLMALALLPPVAVASLSFSANAVEVESEVQLLVVPFWTLVSPFLMKHTSPPWARATPGIAIIAAIIAVADNNTRMRFIGATLPLVGRRKKGCFGHPHRLANAPTLATIGTRRITQLHYLLQISLPT